MTKPYRETGLGDCASEIQFNMHDDQFAAMIQRMGPSADTLQSDGEVNSICSCWRKKARRITDHILRSAVWLNLGTFKVEWRHVLFRVNSKPSITLPSKSCSRNLPSFSKALLVAQSWHRFIGVQEHTRLTKHWLRMSVAEATSQPIDGIQDGHLEAQLAATQFN